MDGKCEYCEAILATIKSESGSLKTIIDFPLYDGCSYEHGIIIVKVYLIMGHEEFQKLRRQEALNNEQEETLHSLFQVGVEYGDNIDISDKDIEKLFPERYPPP
jgi:hypothetical protein